ncbi:HmuY family protein [Cytophaga sp. FL35]|uniref:HmuY family protein n=1 Tax=Cytophaga sp. FL35 TaxID=1904456 RepID=UPI0016534CB6|nr:HmuY family protein [Cytophaga sp. FL35]MBC6997830.1 HmuY family protein [Cytophaga sp. FL35]
MKKLLYSTFITCFLVLASCSDDDGGGDLIDFSTSFSSETVGLSESETSKTISITFSRAATEAGTITVDFTGNNAEYGTDFTTSPGATSSSLTIPVSVGQTSATFDLNKLTDPLEGTTASVSFTISAAIGTDWVIGNPAASVVSFTPVAASSGTLEPEVGGPNQPNMVFLDLSTQQQVSARRDSWEIAFYNGTENRVFLNPALLVSAAELEGITDLNVVSSVLEFEESMNFYTLNTTTFQPEEVEVTNVEELLIGLPVGYSQYGNLAEGIKFTDDKEGSLEGTAFGEISTTAEENNVFIVGLGAEIPNTTPDAGAIATTGDHRGFMKVRILTDGDNYIVQYAELDATTFEEVTIAKDVSKLKTAFSLTSGETVDVEPAREAWDIQFPSVYSYYGPFGGFAGAGLTYSDYVTHNTLGGVGLYQVLSYEVDGEGVRTDYDVPSYAEFTLEDADDSAFVYDDRAVIGSDWRVSGFGGTPSVKDDRYYIVKDASGNVYKLRFTAVLSANGERGYPQFVYEKL